MKFLALVSNAGKLPFMKKILPYLAVLVFGLGIVIAVHFNAQMEEQLCVPQILERCFPDVPPATIRKLCLEPGQNDFRDGVSAGQMESTWDKLTTNKLILVLSRLSSVEKRAESRHVFSDYPYLWVGMLDTNASVAHVAFCIFKKDGGMLLSHGQRAEGSTNYLSQTFNTEELITNHTYLIYEMPNDVARRIKWR